jgi:hypothetical protein
MRTLLLICAIFLPCVLNTPKAASAHLAGQPPFFKINGIYSNLYPVPTTSLEDFALPQDLAPDKYLVGQSLDFDFDTSQLPVTPQALNDTKFFWDFGDGTKGTGLKNTHTYSKMGSYTVVINAQYQSEISQIIQSVMINILPNKDYQLPVTQIKVNGQKSKDPLTDILKLDFEKPLQFDGSESQAKGGQITSYTWDLGDRQTSNEAKVTHHYNPKQIQVFPVLRVKDNNGFISDNFLEVQNQQVTYQQTDSDVSANNPQVKSSTSNTFGKLKIPGAVAILLILIGGVLLFRKRR